MYLVVDHMFDLLVHVSGITLPYIICQNSRINAGLYNDSHICMQYNRCTGDAVTNIM